MSLPLKKLVVKEHSSSFPNGQRGQKSFVTFCWQPLEKQVKKGEKKYS